MNIKRLLGFGVMLWILIFIVWSILIFLPFLEGKDAAQYIIYWVLLIPIVLLLAKWYFKEDPPTWRKGLVLGVAGIVVGTVLDLIITVPLFIKSYSQFYGNWMLWLGFLITIILCILAGAEFDKTFTKPERKD